jgi:hypothetical protein
MIFTVLLHLAVTVALVELLFLAFHNPIKEGLISFTLGRIDGLIVAHTGARKQRAMVAVAGALLGLSAYGLVVLGGLGAVVALPSLVTAHLLPWVYPVSPQGSLLMLSAMGLPVGWGLVCLQPGLTAADRGRSILPVTGRGYRFRHRFLHWLMLESQTVRQVTFWLQCLMARQELARVQRLRDLEPHGSVYVCGLARSGTTLLLQLLEQDPCFATSSYADMPFVLAPSLWKRVCAIEKASLGAEPWERAHGDGVMVSYDASEAFEEVYWEAFRSKSRKRGCYNNPPGKRALGLFKDFQSLVCLVRSEGGVAKTRYLSKNNNNILRLRQLAQLDPKGRMVIIYRQPLTVAQSLLRQHLRFCAEGRRDAFVTKYMGWLGHYEFGLEHLPFCKVKRFMQSGLEKDTLDYWLAYWIAFHQWLLSELEGAGYGLLGYDALLESPMRVAEAINLQLGTQLVPREVESKVRGHCRYDQATDGVEPMLVEQANCIYAQLVSHQNNLFFL